MNISVALDTLLRHLPPSRREFVRKVIDTEDYLAPQVISLPLNELLDLMEEPLDVCESEDELLPLYH